MSIPTANEFIEMFKRKPKNNQSRLIQYAKVDLAHVSGRPSVIFDGEETATIKKYPYLSPYVPQAGDRIQLIGGVIQGAIM